MVIFGSTNKHASIVLYVFSISSMSSLLSGFIITMHVECQFMPTDLAFDIFYVYKGTVTSSCFFSILILRVNQHYAQIAHMIRFFSRDFHV